MFGWTVALRNNVKLRTAKLVSQLNSWTHLDIVQDQCEGIIVPLLAVDAGEIALHNTTLSILSSVLQRYCYFII